MTDQKESPSPTERIQPDLPKGRVKKIMKLDKDIKLVNQHALELITRSTENFLRFLAEKCAEVAKEKKRKIVKLEHIRIAVKRHRPTSDFLLDSLPQPTKSSITPANDKSHAQQASDKPAPPNTRRIDHFFSKPATASEAPVQANET